MAKLRLNIDIVLWGLFVLDIFVVLLYVTFPESQMLNLDLEYNLPTYYQSQKWFLVALLSFCYLILVFKFKYKVNKLIKAFWVILSIGALFISIDEILQVHEGVLIYATKLIGENSVSEFTNAIRSIGFQSSLWLIFYIPILTLGLIGLLIFFKSLIKQYQKELWFFISVFAMFVLVFLMEYLGTTDQIWYDPSKYNNYMIIEELLEMFASSLLLLFVWSCIKKLRLKVTI